MYGSKNPDLSQNITDSETSTCVILNLELTILSAWWLVGERPVLRPLVGNPGRGGTLGQQAGFLPLQATFFFFSLFCKNRNGTCPCMVFRKNNINISVLRIWDPVPLCPLDLGSGMGKKLGSGSGMNSTFHISECLETILWVKLLNFFDADPGWKNLRFHNRMLLRKKWRL